MTQASEIYKRVLLTRKSTLVVGEILTHANLGEVIYSQQCAEMERMDGSPDSLHVEVDDVIKEVSLMMIKRKVSGGHHVRMMS